MLWDIVCTIEPIIGKVKRNKPKLLINLYYFELMFLSLVSPNSQDSN